MNPYQGEKLARQHDADVRLLGARGGQFRQAKQARRARQAPGRQGRGHEIRRRAGWAFVALGLRLAYGAGED